MGTVVSLACREGFLQAFLYPSTQAETSVPSGGAGQGHMPRACYPASPPKSGCFTCRAWIQRSCSPVNHVLSFSHHPKNFAFIFVGGPTFTATSHLFHRSNITASAWQQLRLLWKAARILLRWQIPAQPRAGHTHAASHSLSCMHPEQWL